MSLRDEEGNSSTAQPLLLAGATIPLAAQGVPSLVQTRPPTPRTIFRSVE